MPSDPRKVGLGQHLATGGAAGGCGDQTPPGVLGERTSPRVSRKTEARSCKSRGPRGPESAQNTRELRSLLFPTGMHISVGLRDSPPHVPVYELSTDKVIDVIANMTTTIRTVFPNLQVFPALGNHDYWPQDQLPVVTSKVYNAVADLWKPWLDEEALRTLRKGGFYTQKVSPNLNLRIISLNTNLYYGPNIMTLNEMDPANQFEWLESILSTSQQNKEKVYIIAHIPVGYLPYSSSNTAMREFHNEKLINIFRKYSSVIVGQFYGHTHRDNMMVLSDEKGSPINSLFVAPAVTPVKSVLQNQTNNPGVRLFQYDPHDYKLLDMLQYYLNLTDANLKGESDWKLEYVLTQTYGIEDLQPKSLYGLAKQFAVPGNEQFLKYYNYFFVSYDSSVICDGKCKAYQICAILSLDHSSYIDCLKQHYIKYHS
ncbi:acid sphingomyelinase-like phosphodiesterase 3a isoform X2 [Lutra lutra]|uniref:acid sphingomyelinase-like phosphodiesterase 3a isoform X2 n=1 Tax=Lutra lutra TaxID=9657 RepID=UPI001FD1233E|nr:acid sphingomyelinase-like phosphodiesterase 3a isoform X2 [Lutra lutra]